MSQTNPPVLSLGICSRDGKLADTLAVSYPCRPLACFVVGIGIGAPSDFEFRKQGEKEESQLVTGIRWERKGLS